MPYYLNPNKEGLSLVTHLGDGKGINLKWNRSFPKTAGNKIAYNIYTDLERPIFEADFFDKTASFVSFDGYLEANILDLAPGEMYRFAVRAFEYDPDIDFTMLPQAFPGLSIYPESLLRSNITATSLSIPLLDTSDFPSSGTIKIGKEIIAYVSVDDTHNNLTLTNATTQRGFNGTDARIHNTDGYDGYDTWLYSGAVYYPVGLEEGNTVVFATENKFDVDRYAFTLADGYRQTTEDLVNVDSTIIADDPINEQFPPADNTGFRRTDLQALINGECVGSYNQVDYGCADGYGGNTLLTGLSVDNDQTAREEDLLGLIGEPVCLVRRQWTGIRCSCILPNSEHPEARCQKCYGVGFVMGYSQVFYPRRSDGRIMVRFDPWIDQTDLVDSGLSIQSVKPNAWSLQIPTIRQRDFVVRFDSAGNETERLEVLNVGRNILFNQIFGAQKLALQRIRKTDIIYQVPVFRDISMFPTSGSMTISSSLGIALHSHAWVRNEGSLFNMSQITSISQGHSHILSWNPDTGMLEVSTEVGHSHNLIL